MPELPEVEVTRLGITPGILGRRIDGVVIRHTGLRSAVPATLAESLTGLQIQTVDRRGKFILIRCVGLEVNEFAAPLAAPTAASTAASIKAPIKAPITSRSGTLLVHLGMTGTLRVMSADAPLRAHDHIDLILGDRVLRFNDPRRFGLVLWHGDGDGPVLASKHFHKLGVEPLSEDFGATRGGSLLYRRSRRRVVSIKQFLLAGEAVVGVGNIYASETLFRARIHPRTAAGRISLERHERLADAIRQTLVAAIAKGGSTLRDFVGADGRAGYFQQDYFVYDRAGRPCRLCATPIRIVRQGQRSTFYCPRCQR